MTIANSATSKKNKTVVSAETFPAAIFDMDGVITQTAQVHQAAWKEAFDGFLKAKQGANFKPFTQNDYIQFVDGRPREAGVKCFLDSRNIHLPTGKPTDSPETASVNGLANHKNELYVQKIHHDGVVVYDTSVELLKHLKAIGVKIGLVTASKNCDDVLRLAKLTNFFDVQVDGHTIEKQHLAGKPAGDTYVYAAKQLHVEPAHAVVFEDALSGVEAGKNGHFGMVVGVNRTHEAKALKAHGATLVVNGLDEITWVKP